MHKENYGTCIQDEIVSQHSLGDMVMVTEGEGRGQLIRTDASWVISAPGPAGLALATS